jgi:hypothetical protein
MSVEVAPAKVAHVLRDLFGRAVSVDAVKPPAAADAPSWVALYSARDGIIAVCLCDLPFAAYAGAALSLIPLPVAQESIGAKRLDPSLFDNLREILNIFGQVFRGKILDSVTLHQVSPLSDLEEGPAKTLISSPKSRLDLEVSINGYGGGHLAIFS